MLNEKTSSERCSLIQVGRKGINARPSPWKILIAEPKGICNTPIFDLDETFGGQTDSNSNGGTYSQKAGFTNIVGPCTMAFCSKYSLDQQYLELLGNVAAGGLDGLAGVALENAGGEKRLLFSNGGDAP